MQVQIHMLKIIINIRKQEIKILKKIILNFLIQLSKSIIKIGYYNILKKNQQNKN